MTYSEGRRLSIAVWRKNHPNPWRHKRWEADTCPFRHFLSMWLYKLFKMHEAREKEDYRFWRERDEHGSGRDCKGACDREIKRGDSK